MSREGRALAAADRAEVSSITRSSTRDEGGRDHDCWHKQMQVVKPKLRHASHSVALVTSSEPTDGISWEGWVLPAADGAAASSITRSGANDDSGWKYPMGDADERCNGSNQVAGTMQSTVNGIVGEMAQGCVTEDAGESGSVAGAGENDGFGEGCHGSGVTGTALANSDS